MPTAINPRQFAERLADQIARLKPTEQDISHAKAFVRSRRDKRGEPADRKGHEYVVEAYVRPVVESFALNVLRDLPVADHDRVCSSHYHTSRAREPAWKAAWRTFKLAHPEVDTDDEGHSRRADLFVSCGSGELVSVEFKYIPSQRTPSVASSVAQMTQHLSRHRASILALYAADPPSRRLAVAVDAIRAELAPRCGFVALINGPAIRFL